MPTQNFIFRAEDELHELAKARAKADGINVSDVGRAALREYLTGDDGGEPLRLALHRAEAAEAEVKRLEEKLAAAKHGVPVRDVAGVRRARVDAGRRARVDARKARDDRFAAALGAATAEDPATTPRMATLTGYSARWCRDLLRTLGEAGYAEKAGNGWVPVPGRDIREGVRAAKDLAQRGPNRIAPRRRGKPEAAPEVTQVVFKPPAVKP